MWGLLIMLVGVATLVAYIRIQNATKQDVQIAVASLFGAFLFTSMITGFKIAAILTGISFLCYLFGIEIKPSNQSGNYRANSNSSTNNRSGRYSEKASKEAEWQRYSDEADEDVEYEDD